MRLYKKSFAIALLILFCSLPTQRLLALDGVSKGHIDLFPVQPSLIYDDTHSAINPFEMVSWSPSWFWSRHHRDINDDIRETFRKLKWFDNIKNIGVAFKMELPYYRDKVSSGWDVKGFITQVYDKNVGKPDLGSQFDRIAGMDISPILKFKWPFWTYLGYCAPTLTLSPLGIIVFTTSVSASVQGPYGTVAVDVPIYSAGLTAGAAVGIDCYLSRWIGLYGELCLKYNNMRWFIIDDDSIKAPEPYGYCSTSISFGFKSTF